MHVSFGLHNEAGNGELSLRNFNSAIIGTRTLHHYVGDHTSTPFHVYNVYESESNQVLTNLEIVFTTWDSFDITYIIITIEHRVGYQSYVGYPLTCVKLMERW